MKLFTPAAGIGMLLIAPVLASAQTEAVTDPVGYVTISLPGKGTKTESVSYVGIPMLNSPAFSGAVSSANSTTHEVVLALASFSLNEFVTNGPFYLEVTSGNAYGATAKIASNSANSVTLVSTEDITPSLAQGDSIKIRKYRTIGDVFGATNSAGLVSGVSNNFANADLIMLPTAAGGFDLYFYNQHTNALFLGWRKTTALTVDASIVTLPPTAGFVIKHRSSTPLDITLSGQVQVKPFETNIKTGVNYLASTYPVTTTIEKMFGTNNEAGLVAGVSNNFANADTILIPNSSGGFDIYFYNQHTNALFKGWRKTTALTVNAATTPISTGSTSFVLKRAGGVFTLLENPSF